MHGFWLAVVLPIAGLLAWRFAGGSGRRIATWLSVLTAVGLLGWMGFTAYSGTELTESMSDRVWHSIGKVVVSINVPLVQVMLGCLVFSGWPKRFQWMAVEQVGEAGSEALAEIEAAEVKTEASAV